MPEFSEWAQSLTVWTVAGWLVGIGAVVGTAAKIYRITQPFVRSVREFLEDWRGDPGRPGISEPRPGVPATLADHGKQLVEHGQQLTETTEKLKVIEAQVTPNHGTSAHDKLNLRIGGVEEKVDAILVHLNISPDFD